MKADAFPVVSASSNVRMECTFTILKQSEWTVTKANASTATDVFPSALQEL